MEALQKPAQPHLVFQVFLENSRVCERESEARIQEKTLRPG